MFLSMPGLSLAMVQSYLREKIGHKVLAMGSHQFSAEPGASWEIADGEVHIWLAELEQPPALRRLLAQSLSSDEHERARCFLVERERERFMGARGILRTLLGVYLRQNPAQVRFVSGLHGKPALHPEDNTCSLFFNVSPSQGLALYAITHGREVGVDLEQMCSLDDLELLAQRYLSEGERARMLSLPQAMQQQAFYTCWTLKEALLKATGEGLSRDLRQLEVAFEPGEPTRLVRWETEGDLERWTLARLAVPNGYAGALSVEGACEKLTYRKWEPAQDMIERRGQ